jgi:hypothetical protein
VLLQQRGHAVRGLAARRACARHTRHSLSTAARGALPLRGRCTLAPACQPSCAACVCGHAQAHARATTGRTWTRSTQDTGSPSWLRPCLGRAGCGTATLPGPVRARTPCAPQSLLAAPPTPHPTCGSTAQSTHTSVAHTRTRTHTHMHAHMHTHTRTHTAPLGVTAGTGGGALHWVADHHAHCHPDRAAHSLLQRLVEQRLPALQDGLNTRGVRSQHARLHGSALGRTARHGAGAACPSPPPPPPPRNATHSTAQHSAAGHRPPLLLLTMTMLS